MKRRIWKTMMVAVPLFLANAAMAQVALLDPLEPDVPGDAAPSTPANAVFGKLNLRPMFFLGGEAGLAAIPTQFSFSSPACSFCETSQAPTITNSSVAGGSGLVARGGLHLNDFWGISGTLAAGLAAFGVQGALFDGASYYRLSASLDLTPWDWVTFSAGPLYGGFGDEQDNATTYTGVTGRISFHLRPQHMENGLRRAVTLGLEVNYGWDLTYAGQSGQPPNGMTAAVLGSVGYSFY